VVALRACPFCAIVRGEAAAHVVLDAPDAVAFLDVKPLFRGHVLVVPRAHVAALPDLPEESVGPLFAHVKELSRLLPEALGAEGSFVAMNNVVSQSVPHLHVHVVPRARGDGLRGFFWPRVTYASEADMSDTAARIRRALAAARGLAQDRRIE
jgi:histidine triad (HIT) family protein